MSFFFINNLLWNQMEHLAPQFQWTDNTWILNKHNFMGSLYATLTLNCSYFVHLLSIVYCIGMIL